MRTSVLSVILILLISTLFIQCKSTFHCLPNNIVDSKGITGVYENASILSPFGNQDLWNCIKRRSKIENDGHLVNLQIEKKYIQARLVKDGVMIDKKKIKGTLTDSCFLAKKNYLIVPILPILWFFDNQQIRISARDSSLIIDEFTENGGAAIIMAGGDDRNLTYEYKKINEKEAINDAPKQ